MVVSLDLTQVLLSVVAALSAIATAYIVSLAKKTSEVEAKVELVHATVNTNFQAQSRELKAATDKLAESALQIATLTEAARGADIAAARARGMSEGILMPSPGQVQSPSVVVTNGPTTPAPVPVEIVATVPVPVETEYGRIDHPPEPPPARRTSDQPPPHGS